MQVVIFLSFFYFLWDFISVKDGSDTAMPVFIATISVLMLLTVDVIIYLRMRNSNVSHEKQQTEKIKRLSYTQSRRTNENETHCSITSNTMKQETRLHFI